jgi:hypothetical protein
VKKILRMKKNNPFIIVILWIAWAVGLNYVSEHIISRPINGTIQFLVTLTALVLTVLLVRKTYNLIINLLNK